MLDITKKSDLLDATVRSVIFETFEVSTEEEIAAIKPGNHVKVCAEFEQQENKCNGERFWCFVEQVNEDGFLCCVDNDLLFTDLHGYKFGDKIKVEKHNIIDISA